ncbi:MFHAS1 [Symbiodinium microadriaticum]|nr:MFHAS1 [Symbiodinium microadriaticum]
MAREFRLMNGDSVEGEGLEEETLKVWPAKVIIAQELKLQAQQVLLFDASGVLQDGDQLPMDGLIQIYIQEVEVSMEEFLAKARKKPADCAALSKLTVLAHLTALPKDVGESFPELTHLFLTNNHISSCPASLGSLKKLIQLELDGNQLTDLPESLQQLEALRGLKLDRNQFREIPREIPSMEKLEELSMCSNQLSRIPPLRQLQALKRLALAKNQLEELPSLELPSLTDLSLSQNRLQRLPEVMTLPELKHLDLSFNELQSLPDALLAARQLKELLVNHNRLSSLPLQIGNLSELQDLNLSANVLRTLPETFGNLTQLQNVWLDKGQMRVLPDSSRALLRVAATLYTSLEGELEPAAPKAAAPARRKVNDKEAEKAERIRAIFKSFDLNGDGLIDPSELRHVLRSIRDVGSALSDEMIETVLEQMDTNKDGLVNFEEFLSWLYGTRPSTEKQLLRRAVGILEAEGLPSEAAETSQGQSSLGPGPPSLLRLTSRALAEEAQAAVELLQEEELTALQSARDAKVKSLLEVLSLLMAGMVPGESSTGSSGPLAGVESLMEQPRYFLSACSSVLSWIDEGKLPEQNVESARAVKNSLSWSFQPETLADSGRPAAALCRWMVAIFAYFDAVENWEP